MTVGTALVTGVAGQDGIYLARLLRSEGVHVVGTVLPGSGSARLMAPYLEGVTVQEHDVRDSAGFARLLREHRPDEVYNLAGVTSVGASWHRPRLTTETNGTAVEGILEALLAHPETRFFQASTCEEQGAAADSPYARSKALAHELTTRYRQEHGIFACAGVMFNHESPLRGPHFVSRKITRAAAEIAAGRRHSLTLGNLAVSRDWGHARDYVEAMRLMLRRDEPEDLTIASGVAHSVEDLLVTAFAASGLADPWQYVVQDPSLLRPSDADVLVGDASRTQALLGWKPGRSFVELVREMVAVDVRRVETGVEESVDYLWSSRA